MGELWRRGAGELAAMIKDGDTTSAEVIDSHFDRIEQVNGDLNAIVLVMAHDADNALHGLTRNPWHPDHTAGGSSGGEGFGDRQRNVTTRPGQRPRRLAAQPGKLLLNRLDQAHAGPSPRSPHVPSTGPGPDHPTLFGARHHGSHRGRRPIRAVCRGRDWSSARSTRPCRYWRRCSPRRREPSWRWPMASTTRQRSGSPLSVRSSSDHRRSTRRSPCKRSGVERTTLSGDC